MRSVQLKAALGRPPGMRLAVQRTTVWRADGAMGKESALESVPQIGDTHNEKTIDPRQGGAEGEVEGLAHPGSSILLALKRRSGAFPLQGFNKIRYSEIRKFGNSEIQKLKNSKIQNLTFPNFRISEGGQPAGGQPAPCLKSKISKSKIQNLKFEI